jgi:hypothetical protein
MHLTLNVNGNSRHALRAWARRSPPSPAVTPMRAMHDGGLSRRERQKNTYARGLMSWSNGTRSTQDDLERLRSGSWVISNPRNGRVLPFNPRVRKGSSGESFSPLERTTSAAHFGCFSAQPATIRTSTPSAPNCSTSRSGAPLSVTITFTRSNGSSRDSER